MRIPSHRFRIAAAIVTLPIASLCTVAEPTVEIWHGDTQRVGHLGEAQNDFNVLGHVEPWRQLDTLRYTLNRSVSWTPLSFRAFRRLAADGDFNRSGGLALLAHHVDVAFGDAYVTSVEMGGEPAR